MLLVLGKDKCWEDDQGVQSGAAPRALEDLMPAESLAQHQDSQAPVRVA